MKKILFIFTLFINLLVTAQSDLPNPPNPPRLVNDFTGKFLTSEEKNALEQKLVAYDDSTSNQIAIVIVDDLKGRSRDDYAIELGRKWGVGGQKQFSNGIVILVATGEKDGDRGVFIATGYGLEGAVTDLVAGEIVQNNLVPNFKAGNYYQGLDEATDNIIRAAEGRYTAPKGYHQEGKGPSLFTIILIIFIIVVIISIISRNDKNGGGYVSRRGYTDRWPTRGGGWIIPSGGGGWSGGGSSGGGFGGFGGGSFGGGGAGGSW